MKTKRFQLVEIIKPASQVGAGSKLYIQDQPQLRTYAGHKVTVLQIEAFSADVIPISPSGNNVSDDTAFKNATLTLNVSGTENLQYVPLARLSVMQGTDINAAAPDCPFELLNITGIDWTKSFLTFGAAPAGTVISYLLGVYYTLEPDNS